MFLQQSQQEVICPHCGKVYEFTIHRLIQANKNPALRKKVRAKELFKARCPHCQGTASVAYSFMYLENGFLFHVVQDETDFQNTGRIIENETDFPPELKGLHHRLLHTREELLEKLAIFDAGLDDRIIELLKVVCSISLQKQQPDFSFDEIYFATDGNLSKKVHLLQFNDTKRGQSATVHFDAALINLYNSLADEYGHKIEERHDKDFRIDIAWASAFLQKENV